MKNLFYVLLICSLLFASCKNNQPKDNTHVLSINEDSAKLTISQSDRLLLATAWYQQSAEMNACCYQAFNFAKILLDKHLNEYNGEKKKCIVVDVDETVLDNSPFEVKLLETGNSYTKDLWFEWTDKSLAKALPGAVDFLKYAQSKEVEVFYISNRRLREIPSTLKNLENEQFPYSDTIHLLFKDQTSDKTERRNVVAENYEILLFIGDNLGDFDQIFQNRTEKLGKNIVEQNKEKFGDKFIILPNPMYGKWDGTLHGNDYSISEAEKDKLRKEKLYSY